MSFKVIFSLFLAVNSASYVSMLLDKYFAVKGKWRLSEAYLLSYALFGGGIGMMMGMISFRHKLSKLRFRVAASVGIAVYLALFAYFVFNGQIGYYK